MKNRLLLTCLMLSLYTSLWSQVGTLGVEMYGNSTCDCQDGCFFGTIYNGGQGPFVLLWSNGYTETVNSANFTSCGFCPGTYTVTVTTANTAPSLSGTASGTIQPLQFFPIEIVALDPPPCNNDSLSNGQSDCMLVCAGATVTYTLTNLPSGTSGPASWIVNGATSFTVSPNGQSVSVTWGAPGTGSIRAVSDSGNFCFGQDFLCVTILEPPTAIIGSTPAVPANTNLQICKGQTVDFQNLSTGDADFIEWLFSDDLSNTTVANPQHTFLQPGSHTVTLIAKSDCICADTTSIVVEVIDAEAPSLDCVSTVCPGATVTYTTSNACPPFSWTVSANGTILEGGTSTSDSITVAWNNGPAGLITLNAPSCSGATCPVGGIISIPILSDNAEIRGKEAVCPDASESYSIEPFGGAGFQWTLSGGGTITEGQGTNQISINWWAPANTNTTYWLSVVYDNCYLGCSGRDSIPVKILPSFYLNGPVEACENSNATFNAKLIGTNAPINCNWTMFGPNGAQVWTSGAAAANISPNFIYGDGYYRLFASPAASGQTCNKESDWSVEALPPPAKLNQIKGATTICPGIPYTYEAVGGNASSNYRWTVKNGPAAPQTFAGRTINVVWNASGPYWVSVAHVSNDGLNCASDTLLLPVNPITLVNITGTPLVCEDDKGIYTIQALENVDLTWQVSPATAGSIASGQGTETVEIFWSQAGGHVVNLNVCGQTAVFPVTIPARPAPNVLAPAGLCPGATAIVQTDSPFNSYEWRDGNGATLSTDPAPLLGPGSYAVVVSDPNGCTGVTEFYIHRYDEPNISLTTPDPTGFCNNSAFVNMSALVTADANYNFQWFQDASPLPGVTGTTYVTNQYGLYTVQATNVHGCTAIAGPIRVFEYCLGGAGGCSLCNGQPLCDPGTIQAVVDPTPRCDSFVVVLNDYSGLYVPGSAKWVTGISGGSVIATSTDESPRFVYPNAGRYIVAVEVTLSNGQVCETLDSLTVEAVAQFDPLPECPGEASLFKDVSEFLPGLNIANYNWNFGDPASGPANQSGLRNPDHTFTTHGDYTVQLTVTGASGCTSSASAVVFIPELPDVMFSDPPTTCAGNALEFAPPPNTADIIEITWDFGDPASGASNDASGIPAYHQFATAGNYTVSVTARNIYGCTASFSRPVSIAPNNLSGVITPPNPTICEGKTVSLAAPGGVNLTYVWSDENASTTPFLVVDEEGSFRVTVTNANGCTFAPPAMRVEMNPAPDALIKSLELNDLNQIIGVSYPTVTVCEGEDVVLQAVSSGGTYSYNWSGGNGNQQIVYFTDDRNTLLSVGTYTYTVTVTNFSTGCTMVTTPFQVQVNPKPSGFSISSNGYCAGGNNTLTYNGPQPANWQLFWNTGQTGPTLSTDEPGAYFIRVVNEFGCETRSNQQNILPGPPVHALPAGCFTRCNPDTLCLPPLPTVIAWQWFFNGNPIPGATSPDFVATQSGSYYAQLTDFYGCTAQSDPLTLNLYDGYGNIFGKVWSDANHNGMIDAADTLLSGIAVNLFQNGAPFGSTVSNNSGGFAFANVLSTNYLATIDQTALPPNWQVVIGQAPLTLSGCDVSASANLLLVFQCTGASSSLQLSACAGDSATYQGVDIPAGSSQLFSFPGPGGCDSIVTVTVATLASSSGAATLFACPGDVATYQGVDIPAGSTQQFTLQNAAGCDSVVTVTVQALASTTGAATLFACPGDVATYQGVDIPAGSTQQFTLQNAAGCDSVVTVTVQALAVSNTATLLFGCAGGSITYNGVQVPVGTTQSFTLQNWLGCDSVVVVTVLPLPPSTGSATLYACPGSTANYQGTDLAVGATQQFTLQNWLGCDSIVTVSVQAWPVSSGSATLYACPGSTANYQGTDLAVGATQQFNLQNWLGCDSIVTVSVQALSTSASAFEVGVCPNETFNYQGLQLNGGDVQQFVLQNWLGCDSIVTVTVKQLAASTASLEIFICPGEAYFFNGELLTPGQPREFHLTNAEGCDSTLTVLATEYPATTFSVQALSSCANAPTGQVEAQIQTAGQGPFRYSLDQVNYQDDPVFENLAAGTFTVYVLDDNGCVFEQPAAIPAIPPLSVTLTDGVLPCDSVGVTLAPTVQGGDAASLQFQWWNGAQTPATLATEAGAVWVEVKDQCSTERREAKVSWADLSPDFNVVYVPNVMKPSASDPANAEFRPLFAQGIQVVSMHFEVFDRWGNKLFETESTSDGWNGIFRQSDFNPGVQVWHLRADIAICGRIVQVLRKGDVTIVR